jgi:hypothetical protein
VVQLDVLTALYPRSAFPPARFMTSTKVKGEEDSSNEMVSPNGRRPYFGMTGTKLNIWVTVACTTAMTLFGAEGVVDHPNKLLYGLPCRI